MVETRRPRAISAGNSLAISVVLPAPLHPTKPITFMQDLRFRLSGTRRRSRWAQILVSIHGALQLWQMACDHRRCLDLAVRDERPSIWSQRDNRDIRSRAVNAVIELSINRFRFRKLPQPRQRRRAARHCIRPPRERAAPSPRTGRRSTRKLR